jgi:hypothetical protein
MKKIPRFLCLLAMPLLGAIDYEADIKPIFDAHCIECHGPDKQKASLRVDQRPLMLLGGDSGLPAIVPGDPAKSFLIEAIKGADPDSRMPPKKAGDLLPAAEIAKLEAWVAEGAIWPGQMDLVAEQRGADHWSFQPITRSEPPGPGNPVDAFLEAALTKAELMPNPRTDARSLIRRASIVLTGLPPTPERVASFLADSARDADSAYAALIDELLASPHFGERWAQHWLDVIRWAETNGSESNLYRKNAWIYRDYVVRAFNEDVPYDRFIKEQIAGDQLGVGEATGFLVAGPHVPAATVGQEPSAIRQARADRMDEIMQTVGTALLGVTVSCARCHNHKFDPISTRDYYSLTAVFQGVEFGGRWPEYSEDHPRKQRANTLYGEMARERAILRKNDGQWIEDWKGFKEIAFPAAKTQVLKIEFLNGNVGIDELQAFGPADRNKNLALAGNGAKLVGDPRQEQLRGELEKANDGYFGTQGWRAKTVDGVKPWVELHFPEAVEVDRFRFSRNREDYFETDYLSQGLNTWLPDCRILAKQPDGSWNEVGHMGKAKSRLEKSPVLKAASDRLHAAIESLKEEGPRHSFVGRFMKPAVTRVLHRGSPENPRDEVMPAGFAILAGDLGLNSQTADAKRRLAFAEWLTEPEHPLTSRVMMNRIWHHVFGAGIVPTGGDFGAAGAQPSHPELLDWLASEFVAQKWSMKSMIRLLVTSEAFRRSSAPQPAGLAADAGAALLWRFPPRRVEAEVIRDGILQASGKLDSTLGGRSFRIHNVKKTYAQWEVVNNHGPETWRRMLYQERMRRVDDRIFTAFDFPDCGQVRAKRPVSTTPLQALNLMNSAFVVEQAKFIAERAGTVERVFELLLGRAPTTDEHAACEGLPLEVVSRSLINSNEFAFLP